MPLGQGVPAQQNQNGNNNALNDQDIFDNIANLINALNNLDIFNRDIQVENFIALDDDYHEDRIEIGDFEFIEYQNMNDDQ